MDERAELLERAAALIAAWEGRFGPVDPHPASAPDADRLEAAWGTFAQRMADHYPFFHPRFAGQMLKPPHRVAAAGYLAAMLVNPNNHALDGGPGTTALEVEAVDALADMFGLARPRLGHLTSSGTIANLEALWVAREMTGGKAVVHSEHAHYTHDRMCRVLGVEPRAVAGGRAGRIDLDAVEAACRRGDVGTVVLTAGTTGLGAVDRVDEALALRERYGVRLHVDAAYGGFFTLLAGARPLVAAEPFARSRSATRSSSIPTSTGCSRTGAARCCSPTRRSGGLRARVAVHLLHVRRPAPRRDQPRVLAGGRRGGGAVADAAGVPARADDGLGPMLAAVAAGGAALGGAARAPTRARRCTCEPELDIVTYFPSRPSAVATVDAATERVLAAGMADADDPVFLSTMRVTADAFAQLHPDVAGTRTRRGCCAPC